MRAHGARDYSLRSADRADGDRGPLSVWPVTPACGPMMCGWWTPPGRVRPLAGGRAPFGPGWLRRVRLLRLALPVLLRVAVAPDRDPARAPGRVRADRSQDVERYVLVSVLVADPALLAGRDRQVMIADKNYYGREFETTIASARVQLLRPARKGKPARPEGPVLPAAAPQPDRGLGGRSGRRANEPVGDRHTRRATIPAGAAGAPARRPFGVPVQCDDRPDRSWRCCRRRRG